MPRGSHLHRPPSHRQCQATTKAGNQCSNYALRGRDLCNSHLGIPQRARSRSAERVRIVAGIPSEALAAEDSKHATEKTEREEQLQAALDAQWERREEEARRKAEAAQTPPALTDAERAAGMVYVRPKADRTDPNSKPSDTWTLMSREELAFREGVRLHADAPEPALATPRHPEESLERGGYRGPRLEPRRHFAWGPLDPRLRRR